MTNEVTATTRLDEALAQLIEKSVSGIDKATELLASEIPDVVYQLLLWHGVSSFIQVLVVVIMVTLILRKWFFGGGMITIAKLEKEQTGDSSLTYTLGNALIVGLLIILLELVNIEWLQIWIAPKVWLLEYAAQLVK
jgi:hypothetical protein